MGKKIFAALGAVVMMIAASGLALAENNRHVPASTTDELIKYYTMKYQMDDVYGNSGQGGQWFAVVQSQDIQTDSTGQNVRPYDRWETRGGRMSVLDFSGSANLIRGNKYLWSTNGFEIAMPELHTAAAPSMPTRFIFMVIPETTAQTGVEFTLVEPTKYDVSYDNAPVKDETYTLDVSVGNDDYRTIKTGLGQVTPAYPPTDRFPGSILQTNKYRFTLNKDVDFDKYSTKRTYYTFHQNPRVTPSQTLNIPLVIANVANGSAVDNPLEFNVSIRDNGVRGLNAGSNGQIVSTHHFKWDAVGNRDIISDGGSTSWIFVPQNTMTRGDTLSEARNYTLTLDIKNYCGLRYGLQRYDQMGVGIDTDPNYIQGKIYPDAWLIDLPDDQITDVDREVVLDPKSHIAPGLISRYHQNFNIRSLRQKVLRIYPVDRDTDASVRDLWVNHNRVGGMQIGTRVHTSAVAKSNSTAAGGVSFYRAYVDAFTYIPQNEDFLNRQRGNVREALELFSGDGRTAVVDAIAEFPNAEQHPTEMSGLTSAFSTYAGDDVNVHGVSNLSSVVNNLPDTAVCNIWVSAPQPEYLQYVSDDASRNKVGVLPLHITFNIPGDDPYVAALWDGFLDEWRANGNIDDLFHQYFRVYSRAHDKAIVPSGSDETEYRNRDLSAWLKQPAQNAFRDNIKIMLDEENKMITVNVLAMLVNSNVMKYALLTDDSAAPTSEGARGIGGTRKLLAILDGHGRADGNTAWDMGFYIRRVNYSSTGGGSQGGGTTNASSSGGGGCAAGAAALCAIALVICKRKGR